MRIGLTGGIASGKSTVASWLKEWGYPIIDADLIARQVVEPGQDAYQQIVQHFGEGIVGDDGNILRKKLGAIIFNDEQERNILNKIVHPAVREEMQAQYDMHVTAGHRTIIFDIPLLFESDLFHLVDKVMLVYVDEETQVSRLVGRDAAGLQDAKARIASQMPLVEKRERADAMIDNSGSLQESKQQLKKVLKQWNV